MLDSVTMMWLSAVMLASAEKMDDVPYPARSRRTARHEGDVGPCRKTLLGTMMDVRCTSRHCGASRGHVTVHEHGEHVLLLRSLVSTRLDDRHRSSSL